MAHFTEAAENILGMVEVAVEGLHTLFYIVGIALILSALVQYKQHRDNPMAVTISKPIVLLLLGIGSIILPFAAKYLH